MARTWVQGMVRPWPAWMVRDSRGQGLDNVMLGEPALPAVEGDGHAAVEMGGLDGCGVTVADPEQLVVAAEQDMAAGLDGAVAKFLVGDVQGRSGELPPVYMWARAR